MAENEQVEESAVEQTEDYVEEAVPVSEITSTVSDFPTDFGDAGVADFADPAFDEGTPDEDEDERPSPGEPEPDEDDEEEVEVEEMDEEEPVVPPGIQEEDELEEPDDDYDEDPDQE